MTFLKYNISEYQPTMNLKGVTLQKFKRGSIFSAHIKEQGHSFLLLKNFHKMKYTFLILKENTNKIEVGIVRILLRKIH